MLVDTLIACSTQCCCNLEHSQSRNEEGGGGSQKRGKGRDERCKRVSLFEWFASDGIQSDGIQLSCAWGFTEFESVVLVPQNAVCVQIAVLAAAAAADCLIRCGSCDHHLLFECSYLCAVKSCPALQMNRKVTKVHSSYDQSSLITLG